MRCEFASRKLAACALDELSPADRAEVQAHLAACHVCREAETRMGRAAAALRELPDLPGASERRERALEAMRRGAAERLGRPRWERTVRALLGRRRRWAVEALVAAALLVAVVSGLVPLPSAPQPPMVLIAGDVRGAVVVERAPGAEERVAPGARVTAGNTIRVLGDDAYAAFRVSTGGTLECRGGTSLRLEPSPAGSADTLFTLYYGALWGDLAPLPRGHYVIRNARDHRATVTGTKFEVVCR